VDTSTLMEGVYNVTVTAFADGYETTVKLTSLKVTTEGVMMLWLDPMTRSQISLVGELLLYIALISAALLTVKGAVGSFKAFRERLERYRREVGLMMALGAGRRHILSIFLRVVVMELVIGMPVGIMVAVFMAVPRLGDMLFNITPIYATEYNLLLYASVLAVYGLSKMLGPIVSYFRLKKLNIADMLT